MNKYHIKKKTPLHNTQVWRDFSELIKRNFQKSKFKDTEYFAMNKDFLKKMLIKEFGDKYNPADIIMLISNGYKKDERVFIFKRDDFIK